jgi:uncharacterized protein (DUF362 family)
MQQIVSSPYLAYIARVNGELKQHLWKGLEFIDWKKYVKSDSTVFLKPNFTFPTHEKGVTTSPELLECLLEILKNQCDNVIVGESDGGDRSFSAEEAFKGHGMYRICKEAGVELVNLSKVPSRFVESRVQNKKVKVQLPRMLLEKVDCFISVPVLKVHVITGVSLGIKNLWGCYPDTMRGLHHQNLDYKLALMARTLNPRITIIDGLYGLDVHGPMFGSPVRMDLILASNNVVVADAIGSKIMGMSLKRAKHIKVAEKSGIGTTNLEMVKVNTDYRHFARQFHIKRTLLDNASSLLFYSDFLAKLVMSSPVTPMIYKVAGTLRSPEEKLIASHSRSASN